MYIKDASRNRCYFTDAIIVITFIVILEFITHHYLIIGWVKFLHKTPERINEKDRKEINAARNNPCLIGYYYSGERGFKCEQ